MAIHRDTKLNITKAECNRQTENIPSSTPYKFRTKITADEYDIKMPCGIRQGVANTKLKPRETKHKRTYGQTKLCLKWHMTEQEFDGNEKRKQSMLKKKKKRKTSTKDDIHGRVQRQYKTEKQEEMGRNDEWRPCHRRKNCASRTNDREEAIKRILRRSDKDAPHGASYKTKKNGAVRRALKRISKSRKTSRTAREIQTPNAPT
jgi:hypothetical protein